jgi:AbrB family looped-hinge helix DNA binding protein
VTVKGQVTVPKPLRDHLGLTPGSRVAFVLEADGRVVLRRAEEVPGAGSPPPSRFARARASAARRNALSTEEIMRLTRGEDWGDAG